MKYKLIRFYDFFRYDIPYGIENLIKFFPVVWKYRSWGYDGSLKLFQKGLTELENCIRINGHEVDEDKIPKEKVMQECILILSNILEDNYIEQAEKKLGFKLSKFKFTTKPYIGEETKGETWYEMVDQRTDGEQQNDSALIKLSARLEEKDWSRLWLLIKGDTKIKGSGMKGWLD